MSVKYTLKALMMCCVVALLGAPLSLYAAPPTPADSPCDPQYYDTLEARAWLEAEREITQNQNLISKPDSVLRYSCFDKMLSNYEQATGNMFSGTVSTNQTYDTANSFVNDNFESAHLKSIGGRSSVGSSLDYNCDAMAQVWSDAQCMNFADEPSNDAFFTLAEYTSSTDKRFQAGCSLPSGWGDNSDALLPENTAWVEDDVISFMPYFDADAGACTTSKIMDVGVQALFTTSDARLFSGGQGVGYSGAYDVKLCLRQGCVYVPSSESAGTCEYFPGAAP